MRLSCKDLGNDKDLKRRANIKSRSAAGKLNSRFCGSTGIATDSVQNADHLIGRPQPRRQFKKQITRAAMRSADRPSSRGARADSRQAKQRRTGKERLRQRTARPEG